MCLGCRRSQNCCAQLEADLQKRACPHTEGSSRETSPSTSLHLTHLQPLAISVNACIRQLLLPPAKGKQPLGTGAPPKLRAGQIAALGNFRCEALVFSLGVPGPAAQAAGQGRGRSRTGLEGPSVLSPLPQWRKGVLQIEQACARPLGQAQALSLSAKHATSSPPSSCIAMPCCRLPVAVSHTPLLRNRSLHPAAHFILEL